MYSRARLFATRFDYPVIQEIPTGERILVLCPHPDDDVIGVGGTLRKHIEAGVQVAILILTDGGAGVPDQSRRHVAKLRHQEQLEAAAILGVDQLLFWDYPDGAFKVEDTSASKLLDLLNDLKPDLVYLPSFLYTHPDHRAVTPLLAQTQEDGNFDFNCAAYELNVPILPNVVIDISEQIDIKIRALAAHQSQLEEVNYTDLVKSFTRWRAISLTKNATFVETFYIDNIQGYLDLWHQVTGQA